MVFPQEGPKSSTRQPRGNPPMPRAASSAANPVESAAPAGYPARRAGADSIWESFRRMARCRSCSFSGVDVAASSRVVGRASLQPRTSESGGPPTCARALVWEPGWAAAPPPRRPLVPPSSGPGPCAARCRSPGGYPRCLSGTGARSRGPGRSARLCS